MRGFFLISLRLVWGSFSIKGGDDDIPIQYNETVSFFLNIFWDL